MGTHRLASRDREDGEAPGPTLSGGWLPRPGPEPGQVSPGVPGVLPVLQVLPVPSVLHVPLPRWIWIQLFSLSLLPSPCSDLIWLIGLAAIWSQILHFSAFCLNVMPSIFSSFKLPKSGPLFLSNPENPASLFI